MTNPFHFTHVQQLNPCTFQAEFIFSFTMDPETLMDAPVALGEADFVEELSEELTTAFFSYLEEIRQK